MQHTKFLFMLVLIVVVGAVFLYPGYMRMKSFSERLEKLDEEIKVLEERNTKLREEIEALKNDPHYYEEKAAREMGLAKPGEVVYEVKYPEEKKPEEKKDEGDEGKPEASGN